MLNYMLTLFHAFWADEEGATAIEYGVIVAVLVIAIAAAFFAFGGSIETFLGGVEDKLNAVQAPE